MKTWKELGFSRENLESPFGKRQFFDGTDFFLWGILESGQFFVEKHYCSILTEKPPSIVVSFRSWRLVFDTCFDTLPRRSFEGPCAFPDTSCGQVVATCPQYSALTVRTPAMHHTVRRPRPTVRPCRFATHRLSYRRAAAGHALWLPRQQG